MVWNMILYCVQNITMTQCVSFIRNLIPTPIQLSMFLRKTFKEEIMIELCKVENCDMPLPDAFGKEYGWICPVCGKGLAPWVSMCPCHSKVNTIGTKTNFTPIPGYSESDYRKNQIIHNVDVNSDEFRGAFSGRYA